MDQRSKIEEVVPRWRAGEAQMLNKPEGGELVLYRMSAGAARIIIFYPA